MLQFSFAHSLLNLKNTPSPSLFLPPDPTGPLHHGPLIIVPVVPQFFPKYQFCCIVLIINASGFHFWYVRNFFSSCGFSCSQLHFRDSPGIGPNIARTFLVCAAELGTYDEVKTHLLKSQLFSDGPLAHVLASASAAFASASISTPVVRAQPFSCTLRWRAAALG